MLVFYRAVKAVTASRGRRKFRYREKKISSSGIRGNTSRFLENSEDAVRFPVDLRPLLFLRQY